VVIGEQVVEHGLVAGGKCSAWPDRGLSRGVCCEVGTYRSSLCLSDNRDIAVFRDDSSRVNWWEEGREYAELRRVQGLALGC